VRSEDSLAQEILNEKDETYVYRFGYFDFVLAKEASWGGDRKIKETIIASPRIDIVPSAGRFSSNFKHFKEKRRRKQAKTGIETPKSKYSCAVLLRSLYISVLVVSR
jgi:hypothetical protein